MRLYVTLALAVLALDATVLGQQKPIVPLSAVSSQGQLTGRKKVIYVCRQLDLNKEQRTQARGLIDSIIETSDNQDIPLERVFQIVKELEEAKKNNDKETEDRLSQELRSYGENRRDSSEELFDSLESVLTDAQKKKMAEARDRLTRNPSGGLRPVDIFRAVDELKPTAEQEQTLAQLRKQISRAVHDIQTMKDNDRFQLMNRLLSEIIPILTSEQQAPFQHAMSRLRPDLAYRIQVMTPEEEEAYIQKKAGRKAGEKSENDEEE